MVHGVVSNSQSSGLIDVSQLRDTARSIAVVWAPRCFLSGRLVSPLEVFRDSELLSVIDIDATG